MGRPRTPQDAHAPGPSTPEASLALPGRRIRPELAGLFATWYDNLKPPTRRAYGQDLDLFAKFLNATTVAEAAGLFFSGTHGDANAAVFRWTAELRARGDSPATIARRLASVRALNHLFRSVGLVPWTVELPRLRIEKYRDTFGPGPEAVEKVLWELERRDDPIGARDLVIVSLLFEHALRRGEVASLDLAHLDRENNRIWILGKDREKREAITPSLRVQAALNRWLAVRGTGPGPLITTFDHSYAGGRLTTTSIYRLVRGYGLKRPHGVRHAAITKVIDKTGDIRAAQAFARHKDPKITLLYNDNLRDLHSETVDRVFNRGERRK